MGPFTRVVSSVPLMIAIAIVLALGPLVGHAQELGGTADRYYLSADLFITPATGTWMSGIGGFVGGSVPDTYDWAIANMVPFDSPSTTDMVFSTRPAGWKEAMRITSEGRVGIGTPNPEFGLDVSGRIVSREGFVHLYDAWGGIARNGTDGTIVYNTSYPNPAPYIRFMNAADWTTKMSIDLNSGHVGIGTTEPQATLHVNAVMRLEPQETAPPGDMGDMYVGTDGRFYFHDGTGWRRVALE